MPALHAIASRSPSLEILLLSLTTFGSIINYAAASLFSEEKLKTILIPQSSVTWLCCENFKIHLF